MFSADIPDAVSLRYIDEDSGYAQNECQVYNTPNGNKISEPETIQKVDLWGITGSTQARRIGMYNYGCLKLRPFVHIIEVDIEYGVVPKNISQVLSRISSPPVPGFLLFCLLPS